MRRAADVPVLPPQSEHPHPDAAQGQEPQGQGHQRQIRSVRQGVAAVRGQAHREAQDAHLQGDAEPRLQRDLLVQRAVGEDTGVLAGRHGHGLRQHRPERADRAHPSCREERVGCVGDQALAGHDHETAANDRAVASPQTGMKLLRRDLLPIFLKWPPAIPTCDVE